MRAAMASAWAARSSAPSRARRVESSARSARFVSDGVSDPAFTRPPVEKKPPA